MSTTAQPVNAQINALVGAFVNQIVSVVEQSFTARVLHSFGGNVMRRGPGRPRNDGSGLKPLPINPFHAPVMMRKKAPKQLCPVPGCKNPAAPVFGMVCAKHKDIPKAKIKAFREKRRAANKKK